MIRITSKQDGFRRCGIAHPKAATDYPDDRFTKAELDTLQAEPMLVVAIVANEANDGKKENPKPRSLNVGKTVELIVAAKTLEDLEAIVAGDERRGVMDAAEKRRTELNQPTAD
jgi:hypothetical protein